MLSRSIILTKSLELSNSTCNLFYSQSIWYLLSLKVKASFFRFITDIGNRIKVPVTLRSTSLNVKLFQHKRRLYTDFGFSHYCLLFVPKHLRVFCMKKTIRIVSDFSIIRGNYIRTVMRLKKFSIYKTKGLQQYSRALYLKPRVGKKQQI